MQPRASIAEVRQSGAALLAVTRRALAGFLSHTGVMTLSAKRISRVAGGWALLAVGAALLVLPGPGLLVIAAGLGLLATEYEWAARLLRSVKERIAAVRSRGRKGDAS